VSGSDLPIVLTANDILNGRQRDIKKVVIIGGGATGCEVALDLAEKGGDITIVEQLPRIAIQMEAITRKMIKKSLIKNNVMIITGYRLSRVFKDGALIEDKDKNEIFLKADQVIIAVGNKPYNDLSEQIRASGIVTYCIGDCVEVRSAKDAIYEGAKAGIEI